jgi:D-tyrosyl-tRNA(Tyr) deacylase
MRAVIQRVRSASVSVDGEVTGQIEAGILVLLGVAPNDTPAQGGWLAAKIAGLRIFEDADGKMNHSVLDIGGGVLVVSQFTLYGNCRKGRRPSFVGAAHPDLAQPLYDGFCEQILAQGVQKVGCGVFGGAMAVELVNDGPVTLILDTP